MQVSVENTSDLGRRLTIGVPAERVESEVSARLNKAAKTARIKGFRPGKVPLKVMQQQFGASVRQEVLGEVVNQTFAEAVRSEQLRPAGMPRFEAKALEPGKDLEYVATFEVFPELELKDYSALAVEKPVAEVADSDIEAMIEIFRKQQGSWETADRAAALGDQVNIDYKGTKEGEAFEGGSAEGSDLELGSGRMIPGFDDAIVGMRAGEEKTAALSFPDDYHNESLRGAAVEFAIKVNAVRERRLAELNDEFYALYGVKEGGEAEFRKQVAGNMARELRAAIKARVKAQVMDGLLACHDDLQVPQALIDQEVDTLRQQALQQFGGALGKMDPRQLLPDELFQEQAQRRVKLGLVLNELAARESLKVDPVRVRSMVEELASTYEDSEEVVAWYYSDRQQLQQIESVVLEDQLVDALLAKAQVTEKPSNYQDVMASGQR